MRIPGEAVWGGHLYFLFPSHPFCQLSLGQVTCARGGRRRGGDSMRKHMTWEAAGDAWGGRRGWGGIQRMAGGWFGLQGESVSWYLSNFFRHLCCRIY